MGSTEQFVKIRVGPERFLAFMESFLAGARSGEGFELELDGEVCSFPGDVLARAALDLEFERTPDKTELEVTVEWPHPPSP